MVFFAQGMPMLCSTVLVYFVIVLLPGKIGCLDCYQCTNIRNVSDCHFTIVCAADQGCYTDTTWYGDQTRFTMGCRDLSVCTAKIMNTTRAPAVMVGRSTSQQLECSQCCGVDACNKHLCTSGTHALSSQLNCKDDDNFNCAQVSSLFDVCSDREHAKLVCRRFCGLCLVVDGGWSAWSSWSNCDTTCGSGVTTRQRPCNNPAPEHGGMPCIGNATETHRCNLPPCPVNGGWTSWSTWDSCSHSCGIGSQERTRLCSNPSPSHGGLQCQGSLTDIKACFLRSCADGLWSSWSSWSSCSHSCLGGLTSRYRQCNSPTPSTFGHDCVGNNQQSKICNSIPCQGHAVNGGWSSWGTWSSCSSSCGGGMKTRTRTCSRPYPANFGQSCIGNNEDKNLCNTDVCPAHVVNGGWSSWGTWSSCSSSWGIGMKTRTRTCSHPYPANFGESCIGTNEDKTLCNTEVVTGASLVRLIGPTNFEGRLEVFYNGGWGTVCDDSFTDIAAQTVCRMMNLPWTGAIALPGAFYGPGILPIKLDDVRCSNNSKTLFDCRFSTIDNCGHGEDVGVACYPPLQVRLQNGSSSHNGRVEVSFDGNIWGNVCDDDFNNTDAKVVCRMLGFTTTNARAAGSTMYEQGSGDILLGDIRCTGSEDTLLKCHHSKLSTNNCRNTGHVGVICG